MKLTPFEQAQATKEIVQKRVEMTIKIQELVKKLEECELYLASARMFEGDDHLVDMFTPQLIRTVEQEVKVLIFIFRAALIGTEEVAWFVFALINARECEIYLKIGRSLVKMRDRSTLFFGLLNRRQLLFVH